MQRQNEKTAHNGRILIVEDSAVQARALRNLFARHGYEALVACNGAEGLGMARAQAPSIIVSDVLMPVMDGYRMTRELKNDAGLKAIPVILLTQLVEVDEVISGLDCGAENYVTKPYDEAYLLGRVESLLRNPRQFRNNTEARATEFDHDGKHYSIRCGRGQAMSFLLSTYENAILKNKALVRAQEDLLAFNEELEKRVAERTETLSAEVAERKQAEKALMESEERFRAVVESASDAVVCVEPPGNIYIWNSRAEAIFGYAPVEAIGKPLHDLIVPERYRKKADDGIASFFKTGTGEVVGRTVELTALRKDGTEFPVELSVAAMRLRGAWNSIGIIRDITERKGMEEELRQNLDHVERMNKLMVGRELKMEELRTEIRALKDKVCRLENPGA